MTMKDSMSVPAAVEAVTGMRPSPAKCWRWYTHGIKGVKLRTWLVGGSRRTNIEAVKEFIEALSRDPAEVVRPPKPRKLSKETREFLDRELGLNRSSEGKRGVNEEK